MSSDFGSRDLPLVHSWLLREAVERAVTMVWKILKFKLGNLGIYPECYFENHVALAKPT